MSGRGLLDRAFSPVDIATIAVFRVAFGALMACEVGRYFRNGWIRSYYIEPSFHFTYFGFGWLKPWPAAGMYLHFVVLGVAAVGVMLGLRYRLCAVAFLLGFAYVFLLDEAFYLNHFYLITLLALVLVFIPANGALSLDAVFRPAVRSATVPAWTLWLLRAQVAIPYFYGGMAKINGDWLRGEPIASWLAERTDFPVLGRLFTQRWMGLTFAYGGLAMDLLLVPFLIWKRTRLWAFGFALLFHALNARLFQIGIFPWLMMAATLIFFEPDWPRRLGLLPPQDLRLAAAVRPSPSRQRLVVAAIASYLAVQTLIPLRHLAYPGDVSWTEEGHFFSWRMKLRYKEGTVSFLVKDGDTGQSWTVRPRDHLSARQVRRMVGQPDMILQFAHYLAQRGRASGRPHLQVRAVTNTSLNGREGQPLVDPETDLACQARTLQPATWIVPLSHPLRPGEALPTPRTDEVE